jgi:hypothetical protein
MWNFMTQSGIATTVVDFTSEFSPLLVGLVSLVWLSIGVIVVIAIRHYLTEKTRLVPRTEVTAVDRRKAA